MRPRTVPRPYHWDTYDSSIMGQVAANLVNSHSITVSVDPYHLNSPYSFYGLGMSLLMLPTLEISHLFGGSQMAGEMLTNVWLLGVLAGVVYWWCRLRGLAVAASALVALVGVLGGGFFVYASTGLAEVALCVAVAFGLLGITAICAGLPGDR